MNENETEWKEVKKDLDITPEEETEIQLEQEIIEATIQARKSNKLSQRQLSEKTGIKQPAIARLEKKLRSPRVSTLIRILYPLGYTIKVVPMDNNKNRRK